MHIIDNHDEKQNFMSLSAHSIQGRRDHMEDNFDIAYQVKPLEERFLTNWPYEYFYFGIFDGHGGSDASEFVKQNLVKFITKNEHFWSDNDQDVMRAIRDGFRQTQEAMRKDLQNWSNPNPFLPSTAGTTASVLFIKNGKFYSGHVGDSRILIVREHEETKMWLPNQITEDHKPELESEIERINKAGGEVKDKLGVQRVVWRRPVFHNQKLVRDFTINEFTEYLDKLPKEYPINETEVDYFQRVPFLAIARSLGDFWSLHPFTGQYIVSPEPDVTCRPITAQDKAIVLASDGLWNVLSSYQVSRMLQELNMIKSSENNNEIKEQYFSVDNYYDVAGKESKNHAKSLVYYAFQNWERRKLRSDNITVVTAMLFGNMLAGQKSTVPITPTANYSNIVNHRRSSYATRSLTKSTNNNEFEFNPHNRLKFGWQKFDEWGDLISRQIGETFDYHEELELGEFPTFNIAPTNVLASDEMRRLENLLVLPPTIMKKELECQYNKLVIPKNYLKLTATSFRRIRRHIFDTYIYIKHVSDDPDDTIEKPIRYNQQGKEIRDSSAQATQSIHDFGQAWIEMIDKKTTNNSKSASRNPSSDDDDDEFYLNDDDEAEDEEEEEDDEEADEEEELNDDDDYSKYYEYQSHNDGEDDGDESPDEDYNDRPKSGSDDELIKRLVERSRQTRNLDDELKSWMEAQNKHRLNATHIDDPQTHSRARSSGIPPAHQILVQQRGHDLDEIDGPKENTNTIDRNENDRLSTKSLRNNNNHTDDSRFTKELRLKSLSDSNNATSDNNNNNNTDNINWIKGDRPPHLRCLLNSPRPKYNVSNLQQHTTKSMTVPTTPTTTTPNISFTKSEQNGGQQQQIVRRGGIKRGLPSDCPDLGASTPGMIKDFINTTEISLQCDLPLC